MEPFIGAAPVDSECDLRTICDAQRYCGACEAPWGLLFSELGAAWGPPLAQEGWRDACAAALAEQLASDAMHVAVVDGDAGLASCGMGVVDRQLPTRYDPEGLVGHVFGVATDPRYRKRGYAHAVMMDLLRWFDGRGLRRVDLNASPDGQNLCRGLGFKDHPDPVLSRKRGESP